MHEASHRPVAADRPQNTTLSDTTLFASKAELLCRRRFRPLTLSLSPRERGLLLEEKAARATATCHQRRQ